MHGLIEKEEQSSEYSDEMEQSLRKSQTSSQVVTSRRLLAKRPGSEVDHSSCNEHYEFY